MCARKHSETIPWYMSFVSTTTENIMFETILKQMIGLKQDPNSSKWRHSQRFLVTSCPWLLTFLSPVFLTATQQKEKKAVEISVLTLKNIDKCILVQETKTKTIKACASVQIRISCITVSLFSREMLSLKVFQLIWYLCICAFLSANLEEAEPCTPARDAVCRCKANYYCNGQNCQVCQPCKE